MQLKKNKDFYELNLSDVLFYIEDHNRSNKLNFTDNVIISDKSFNFNYNKIFNSAGEYNVDNIYIWGFDTKNYISYFFDSDEGTFLYAKDISEDIIKKIKMLKKDIDVVFFNNYFNPDILRIINPRLIFVDYKNKISFSNFKIEKGNNFKLNLKKVSNLIYQFE